LANSYAGKLRAALLVAGVKRHVCMRDPEAKPPKRPEDCCDNAKHDPIYFDTASTLRVDFHHTTRGGLSTALAKLGKDDARYFDKQRKAFGETGSAEALGKGESVVRRAAVGVEGWRDADTELLLGHLRGSGKSILQVFTVDITNCEEFCPFRLKMAAAHAAIAMQVRLHWDGTDMAIDVIDSFAFNEDGKVTEMKAYFGPTNMTAG
jgi:hypothetical protein